MNGPEVLSKFVGETEKNVRDLFADAENDQKNLGAEDSVYPDLCYHVFLFLQVC